MSTRTKALVVSTAAVFGLVMGWVISLLSPIQPLGPLIGICYGTLIGFIAGSVIRQDHF